MSITYNEYYIKTNEFYTKGNELNHFIQNEAAWAWVPHFYVCTNFNTKRELLKDNFLKKLDEKFNASMQLWKIPANCMYKWHTDFYGKWAFNMVLENYNSHTLFATKHEESSLTYFTELKYQPCEWVIFNTSKLHSVINTDDQERFLVSYRYISKLPDPNPVQQTYEDVVNWFLNERL